MDVKKNISLLSIKNSDSGNVSQDTLITTAESSSKLDDGQAPSRSTYESFSWLLSYTQMFTKRLAKDLLHSLLGYFYSGQLLPIHIVDLMNVHRSLRSERESQTVTYRSSREHETTYLQLSVRELISAFKSCILYSEDDYALLSTYKEKIEFKDRETTFVIVDSSGISNPSSRELLFDVKNVETHAPKKHSKKNFQPSEAQPIGMPSTSTDWQNVPTIARLKQSDSRDELLMTDINLQSENEILINENDAENESIVLTYLRNKNKRGDLEGTISSSKKKCSIIEDVPKMETIVEGKQLSSYVFDQPRNDKPEEKHDEDQSA